VARKPVIFIPGFPASELHDSISGQTVFPPSLTTLLDSQKKRAFLNEIIVVPGPLIAGLPITAILGIAKQAQSLYDILGGHYGYDISGVNPRDFAPIGWDWREAIDASVVQQSIRDVLDLLSPNKNQNVVAIVHSTGGLVFRAFLEANPAYAQCFEQVLAFGVPWCGTLAALHAVNQGESAGFLFIKLISASESASMISHAQAAYDLLPTDPSTNLFISNGQATTPLADQSWIPNAYMRTLAANAHPPFARRFDALPVTNVCGWGVKTLERCTLTNGRLSFQSTQKNLGDGTVPLVSSEWLQGSGVRSMVLPIGAYATNFIPRVHAQIWDSPPVLQLFDEVLNDRPGTPFICAAADSDDYIDYSRDVRIRLSAIAADGLPLPNCVATINFNGGPRQVALSNILRAEVLLKRANIQHNIDPDLYRFTIDFGWDGGQVQRVVVIRAV
jgi:lecithin:cholesterol acyltransferase